MMKKQTYHSGFSIIEVVIVVIVLCLIGFIGYTFYNRQANQSSNDAASQSTVAKDVSEAPAIDSTSDLDKALTTLDQADTNSSSDSAELDSQLQAF